MAVCIYCASNLTTESASDEHSLPLGLGTFKGYEPLKDTVCKVCNQACGQLDEQLLRSGPESFFREHLGVSGRKKHKKKNVFYTGSSGGARVAVSGTSYADGTRVELDPNKGSPRELRHLQVKLEDGSERTIPIPDGMTRADLAEQLRRLGIEKAPAARIFCAQGEEEWIDDLLEPFSESQIRWTTTKTRRRYGDVLIKLSLTDRYFRAIAKIGFHYFLQCFGSRFRGDEPYFAEVRSYIRHGQGGNIMGRPLVTYDTVPLTITAFTEGRVPCWGHLLAAEVHSGTMLARLQLFLGPEYNPPSFTVVLGRQPTLLTYDIAEAAWFEYYPPDQRGQFAGEVHPVSATEYTLSV